MCAAVAEIDARAHQAHLQAQRMTSEEIKARQRARADAAAASAAVEAAALEKKAAAAAAAEVAALQAERMQERVETACAKVQLAEKNAKRAAGARHQCTRESMDSHAVHQLASAVCTRVASGERLGVAGAAGVGMAGNG